MKCYVLALLAGVLTPWRATAETGSATADATLDCSANALVRTNTDVPWWSRWSWSTGFGFAFSEGTFAGVVVPQVSVAVWFHERACKSEPRSIALIGLGSPWVRWSVSLSADTALRFDGTHHDLRPGLRVSRANFDGPLLGSVWTPDYELYVSVGPVVEGRLIGAAASIGGRVTFTFAEVRGAVLDDDRGVEVIVMLGLTDLHGVAPLGKARRP